MATINGTQSVFVSVPTPECQTPASYNAYIAGTVRIAEEMAMELHAAAEAEWLADEEAQAEYQAWCEETDRGFPTDEDFERMEAESSATYGIDAYVEELNAAPPHVRFKMVEGGGK